MKNHKITFLLCTSTIETLKDVEWQNNLIQILGEDNNRDTHNLRTSVKCLAIRLIPRIFCCTSTAVEISTIEFGMPHLVSSISDVLVVLLNHHLVILVKNCITSHMVSTAVAVPLSILSLKDFSLVITVHTTCVIYILS